MKYDKSDPKYVGKNVVENVVENVGKPKKPKYKKGKFKNTVIHVESKTLFVRKSFNARETLITGEEIRKQKQIWRVCDPQTQERATQILTEIENTISQARSGRELPLSRFAEVAERFESSELVPAVFRDGKKVAGLIQSRIPKLIVKRLINYFGDRQISEINYQDILEYKSKLLHSPIKSKFKSDKPRSIRSVNYDLALLRQIFKFALQKRWLQRSPFEDGRSPIETSQENKRNKTWTKAEESAALALCTGIYKHMKAVIICICDGGFRKNELLSAKWNEVDFENKVMLAKNYKGNQLRLRPVFLTNRMKDALLEWQQLQPKSKKVSDHSLVIGFSDVKKAWIHIRDKIGRSDLHLHDLRHVFATRLNENKVQLKNISQLLGHSQISTTQIYLNPSLEGLRSDVETLELDQIM